MDRLRRSTSALCGKKERGHADFPPWPYYRQRPPRIHQASRYFSNFDRFFRLPGNSFSDRSPPNSRTGNTYQTSSGTTYATRTSISSARYAAIELPCARKLYVPSSPTRCADFTCTFHNFLPASTMKSYRSLSPHGQATPNFNREALARNAASAISPNRFAGVRVTAASVGLARVGRTLLSDTALNLPVRFLLKSACPHKTAISAPATKLSTAIPALI